jgi:dTMP kinase
MLSVLKKGMLISFEGPEGSGKSTHIARLGDFLRAGGFPVQLTREPGGSPLGVAFRRILLEQGDGLTPLSELFLYEADRAQHVQDVIKPALAGGKIVLCDRFTDSTLAYQGWGRGLDRRAIQTLNAVAAQNIVPDLTILLDVPVERGLRLAHAMKKGHDRLERAGLAFHRRVRTGFLALARSQPKRFRVIPQQEAIEATQQKIKEAVTAFLKKRKFRS